MGAADVTDPSPVVALDARAHALAAGDQLGEHFRIVALLGAGGMGQVYRARDARLERDVAIKVVQPGLARAGNRLVSEARAMARLGHPNVVAVHEVGEIGDQVFIAMELVDGPTLRAWLPGKRPADIVRAFASCASALAAAHRAGLVHGDFKPDNVLVGADGRARVADFGLAHTGDANAPRGGTPAFMAPELAAGGIATAASDQFALCVALRDAIAGRLARIAPIVARGTAAAPEQRYPSMDAVAAALARDPAARRKWYAVGAVALAVVVAAATVGFLRGRTTPCEDDGDALAGAWDPAVADAVRTHFAATGAPYADDSFARVRSRLDAYRDAWTVMHHEACVATSVRGDQSATVLDLRMQCLDRRRGELAALTAHLASDARIDRAIDAAAALPAIADCADTATLGAVVPPPTERRGEVAALTVKQAELRVRVQLGAFAEARADAEANLAEARRIDYGPALATSLMMVGDVTRTSDPKGSEAAYREAITAASRGRDHTLVARAWLGLYGQVIGVEQKLAEEPEMTAGATAAVALAGDPRALRLRLLARVGDAKHDLGKLDEAEAAIDEVLKLAGDDDSSRGSALMTRALVERDRGDLDAARTTARAALAANEKAFGPNNPMIVGSLATLASLSRLQGDMDDAEEQLARGLAIEEAAFGKDSLEVAKLLTTRGTVYEGQFELDPAEKDLRRALEIKIRVLGADHRDVANAWVNLSQVESDREDWPAARDAGEKALAIYEAKLGDHLQTALAAFNVGNVDRRLARYDDARAHYTRALAIYTAAHAPPASVAGVYEQLAHTEQDDHHPDAAIEALRKALALRDTPGVRDTLGQLLEARGDWSGAEAQFEAERAQVGDGIELVPALLGLGRARLATGHPREAIQLLEQAQALAAASPQDPIIPPRMRAELARTLATARGR